MTALRRLAVSVVIATLALISGAGTAAAAGPEPAANCPWWGCVVF